MPEMPEVPGAGIISKAEGAAGEAQGAAAAPAPIGVVEGAASAAGATVSAVSAVGTAAQGEAQPAAVVAAGTGVVASATSGKLGAAADAAHEGAAGIAAGKDLPDAARDLASQKGETAVLGTKSGEKFVQVKGLKEDAAQTGAELADSAKETAGKAGKDDDSSDIEE